ncbi:MAG TPA: DUF2235 domain-containing protein [Acidobacteriaceae bacterium]|nr:DUF2235 domain-containing protein [Acidobacteriaceae bacterium]
MKKIVYCADGTWDGKSSATNVFKLFSGLVVSSQQMPFYDTGVGADGFPLEKYVEGAFGAGLFQKIKDGYTKISQVYEAGDELFLFGFSRGAYTARSLAGMIAICGLPSKNFDDQLVESAFNAYRNRGERAAILATVSAKYSMCAAQITMVGVWDTVGSLGVPAVFGKVDPVLYGFLDTSLNPVIKNAFQALAIDERRRAFPPTLWTSQGAPGQTVQQVWFCGVHSDVGGGYEIGADASATALSDITLSWMMNKAQNLGVEFSPTALTQCRYPVDPTSALDQLHNSWSALWGFPIHRTIPPESCLANSVLIRCQHHDGYSPCNLSLQNGIPAATYPLLAVVADPPAANPVANPAGCAPTPPAQT